MVTHPAEYPWSSYQGNSLDKDTALLTPHPCYKALGKNAANRKVAYIALFKTHIAELTLTEIRDATNKAWILGENSFKEQIAQQTGRRSSPQKRGGDRKSKAYRGTVLNQ